MSKVNEKNGTESYKFHHIDVRKCLECDSFACEDKCFRGVYEVLDKENRPRCVVIDEREEMCVKCHICTTACPHGAIVID